MNIPVYVIDAFTDTQFHGNPAAVCPLEEWLDDNTLQAIAAENNLSETAFFVKTEDGFKIRWFTPAVEVSLCGHATLATSYVIFKYLKYDKPVIRFDSMSGVLVVSQEKDMILLDFPDSKANPVEIPELMVDGLGAEPVEVLKTPEGYLAVFKTEDEIKNLNPNFDLLAKLDLLFVVVTAKGSNSDFVSRFFGPKVGIPEDPVTGSVHCTLVPYWADKLGKTSFRALQLSERGGELTCEYQGDRVIIGGKAVTYSIGNIYL